MFDILRENRTMKQLVGWSVSQSVILTQSEGYQATKSASPLLHNLTVDILFRHFVIPLCIRSARRVKIENGHSKVNQQSVSQ